jgi:hypothetical protein
MQLEKLTSDKYFAGQQKLADGSIVSAEHIARPSFLQNIKPREKGTNIKYERHHSPQCNSTSEHSPQQTTASR